MVSIFIIVMPNGSDYGQGSWTQCHVAQNPFQEQESWLQTTWNILWPKSWSLHRTSWQICTWQVKNHDYVHKTKLQWVQESWRITRLVQKPNVPTMTSSTGPIAYSSPCLLELGRLLDHQSRSQTLSVVHVHTTTDWGSLEGLGMRLPVHLSHMTRPYPAHVRRRGLVSQVQILGLAPEAREMQSGSLL